jgi:hypothetical protein
LHIGKTGKEIIIIIINNNNEKLVS